MTRPLFRSRRSLIDPRDVPWITVAMIFAALCVGWLAQYAGGLVPCELCYWQRYGYWAAIAVGVFAVVFSRTPHLRRIWLALMGLALLGVTAIAVYHVGVEQAWWQGSGACVGVSTAGMTTEEMTAAIMNAPITRCDEPAFEMFGISMAGYNAMYALALALFAFWGATRPNYR